MKLQKITCAVQSYICLFYLKKCKLFPLYNIDRKFDKFLNRCLNQAPSTCMVTYIYVLFYFQGYIHIWLQLNSPFLTLLSNFIILYMTCKLNVLKANYIVLVFTYNSWYVSLAVRLVSSPCYAQVMQNKLSQHCSAQEFN